jgi:hypothetical protein
VSGPAVRVIPFGECGGEDDVHFLVISLDERPPRSHPAKIAVKGDEVTIRRVRDATAHSCEVSRRDGETFSVYACAKRFAYTWRLVMRWSTTDGRPHTTVLSDEGGKPFVTVPLPDGAPVTSLPVGLGYGTDRPTWQDTRESTVDC